MEIRIETREHDIIVMYEGTRVIFDNMEDAQEFAMKLMIKMGKLGY